MRTDALIESLAADLAPVSQGAVVRRIVLGLGLGALTSAALMLGWLGLRPDILEALSTMMFWVKLAYTTATGVILAVVLTRLARPAVKIGALAAVIAAPFLGMLAMASMRLMHTDPASRLPLMMGGSSELCPWRIVIFSLPPLAGAIWAVRGLAPTRLVMAGLAAGGCAGGFGAAIYTLACGETASPFVVIWYTLGMAIAAALGALAGARWLRWT